MGDLLFVGCHPYLTDGDGEHLSSILMTIAGMDADIFVPGHGPVGTRQDLHKMNDYIKICYQAAEGLDEERLESQGGPMLEVPRRFGDWRLPSFYEVNARSLRQRMV